MTCAVKRDLICTNGGSMTLSNNLGSKVCLNAASILHVEFTWFYLHLRIFIQI